MRELEPLLLYQALESKFYHLKEQIKVLKQLNIDLKKMRNLINSHLLQIVKSLILTATLSLANLANSRKQNYDQEDQFRDQFRD